MGLSRLDNFLKSSRGTILYVNPNDLDSTDSIENKGNSLTRPFKTIQRALIESARFSYQRGLNNDRFGKTTILIYPGEHTIDNRPGYIPDGTNNYRLRNGGTTNDLPQYDLNSNFDVNSVTNELHKLNSIHGGVIVPRGTSLVGLDLRKTKIRAKYVPDPENDQIERCSIFRITGGCYFWQFSMFDADPNGSVYKDYTTNTFVPNFSHHKLSCFEYADGLNNVAIDDDFINNFVTDRTDLDMYYEKISLVYGQSSGRTIAPDYPSTDIDIEKKIDEYRIVGSTGVAVGISSIKSGDGVTGSTVFTVTTDSSVTGLEVDTPFRIEGVTAGGYNGQYVVSEKVSSTEVKFNTQTIPGNLLPSVFGATLSLQSDTVTSASPYIFNISLRSVFGMCGMEADGRKATGFKSMVVAQFTGIGLQKDDKAFVLFNDNSPSTGLYDDSSTAGNETLSNNSKAKHKPSYRNFHIRSSNNSVIQAVSCFAIGYAEQFSTVNGGDISLTNSNSNFGAVALVSEGFRPQSFNADDHGYITHLIPPRSVPIKEKSIEFLAIDILKTLPVTHSSIGVGSTGRLYLYEQKNSDVPPEHILQGYRVGSRTNDQLCFVYSDNTGNLQEYASRIIMPVSDDFAHHQPTRELSARKTHAVGRSIAGINSIGSSSIGGVLNVISLKENHSFINGESVRVISENGHLPDGLDSNTAYFAITSSSGISTTQNIKLAKTLNDAINDSAISFNNKGGELSIQSRVSDKNPNDIGHPIQYDINNSHWYINVSLASTENAIYTNIVGLGSTSFGDATPRTFIKRLTDDRNSFDRIYHARYIIPKTSTSTARPPIDGYIVQESNTSIGSTDVEIGKYYGTGSLSNAIQHRNLRFISNAEWNGSDTATINTELPHKLTVGTRVGLQNITSTNNSAGTEKLGFNREFVVSGISSAKQFTVGLTTNPGTITNNTSTRNTSLPYFKRLDYPKIYYVYRINEKRKYITGEQDGVYYLTLVETATSPTVSPFSNDRYSQPVKNLYPQLDRDNPQSDPKGAQSHAKSSLIGQVDICDATNSITKTATDDYNLDTGNEIGISKIESTTGSNHVITTDVEHNLNSIVNVSFANFGANYGSLSGSDEVYYNAKLVGTGSSSNGVHATAKVTVGSGGSITNLKIMDGGSAYEVGNTLTLTGITTSSNLTEAAIVVDNVRNDVGQTIRVSGITTRSLLHYNDVYRITDIQAGAGRSFTVSSASTFTSFASSFDGNATASAGYYLTGEEIRINTFAYDYTSGIATVTTLNHHGLDAGRVITLGGADQELYNGSFAITEILDQLSAQSHSFSVNIGVGTTAPTQTGTMFAYHEGHSANNSAMSDSAAETIRGRMTNFYAGISTTLQSAVANLTDTSITIRNVGRYDLNIGDYLSVNDEIMRVKTTTSTSSVTGNAGTLENGDAITVFRGVLGTRASAHVANTTIRKVNVIPIEFRRHSIIRASGHTFEYVGYGPGNYSTGFPDKQDRQISSQEELLAQSAKRGGGINFYTGMNDKGISYSGNKRLSTITGREEIFDTPVQSITGEDILGSERLNVISPLEGVFDRSIRVDGGNSGESISQFNGPLVINNKLVVNSSKGVETDNLFLQGEATVARKYTVGLGTPTLAGNPGDVVYNANPDQGGSAGWIYTRSNVWRSFGTISLDTDLKEDIFSKVGIATTTSGDKRLLVWSGTKQFSVDENGGVGIGTSANEFDLNVIGRVNIDGETIVSGASTVGNRLVVTSGGVHVSGSSTIQGVGVATIGTGEGVGGGVSISAVGSATTVYYYGDGSNLVNLNADQVGWIRQGNNLSYEDVLNGSVGIGTSIPTGGTASDFLLGYSLTVGSAVVGTSGTSIHIHDDAHVTGQITINNGIHVTSGISTILGNYSIGSTATTIGKIVGTHITSTDLNISGITSITQLRVAGITTTEDHSYLHSFSEKSLAASISSGILTLQMNQAQNFEVTISETITKLILAGVPVATANDSNGSSGANNSMSFTIKFTQASDANYAVDIDDFEYNSSSVEVRWPGNVVPTVSRANSAIDIYSFKCFDLENINSVGMYGIVGGQNFS